MSKKIEIVVLDHKGYEEHRQKFGTKKEAKAWVKECGLKPTYWDRTSEIGGYAENIATIQLVVNGDVEMDWFPEFKCAH